MLHRQGRISYRALKRRYELTDEDIEDVKAELIDARRLATDEDGRVLVLRPPGSNAEPRSAAAETDANPTTFASTEARMMSEEAQRRQITVMFCDLADSTSLSGRLDPEDLRELVQAYQQVACGMIERFDGHVAQYLGDGVLVYFGYPSAHEDDAHRAVRAGLGILGGLEELSASLERRYGVRVALRIGIHTGVVVVGDVGGGRRHERLALGETPNVAARLQELAVPNTLLVSGPTRQLLHGAFDLEDLGIQQLEGLAKPMRAYRVHRESAVESRFEAATTGALTPLVGRDGELGLLVKRWEDAKAGEGQMVILVGEPGIGKSRLIEALRHRIAGDSHTRLRYQCSPYYASSALYPFIVQLERAAHFEADDTAAQKLAKLEAALSQAVPHGDDVMPLFAAMMSVPIVDDRYRPLTLSPEKQRAKTIEALGDQLLSLARRQPLFLTFEDAHWADPTSVDVLTQMVPRIADNRVLVVITCRPEFVPPRSVGDHITSLSLQRLSRAEVMVLIGCVAGGKPLPREIVAEIVAKTDGVPLFVEELTKSVLESQLLHEGEDRYELVGLGALPSLTIPATLQDVLMTRLDRLNTAKMVAQIAATLGRTFAYSLLQEVAELDDVRLGSALRSLVDAELLYQRGIPPEANYTFKHALIQEAAYQSLLKSARQQIHKRVVQTLQGQFPEITEGRPELLAHHCSEAGMNQEAVGYLQRAGQHAIGRSASREAMTHFSRALEILASVPENAERSRQEVDLLLALGTASFHATGQSSSDTERAYAQALARSRGSRDRNQLFHSLWGQAAVHRGRAQFLKGYQVCQEMLALAREHGDPTLLLHAHVTLCQSSFYLGRFLEASEHLHHQLGLYHLLPTAIPLKIPVATDPRVVGLVFGAWALWFLGHPDQAMTRSQQCIALARQTSHAHNIALSRLIAARLHEYRGEPDACLAHAEVVIAVATENDLPQRLGSGIFIRGSALATKGETQKGLAQMREGMALWRATGAEAHHTYYPLRIAEVYGRAGDAAQGLRVIEEILMALDQDDERFCEAELYRIKGRLVLLRNGAEEEMAEACFLKGLETARHQDAKSLELRAAMDLARLWLRHGKVKQAHDLLAPVYNWFTEGLDTADLNEARALIDALA